jgi:hypothetical protein
MANLKSEFEKAEELDGYEELEPQDQAKLDTAWETGHVADEDIPDSARKPDEDGDEDEDDKPKKKRAASKKVPKVCRLAHATRIYTLICY